MIPKRLLYLLDAGALLTAALLAEGLLGLLEPALYDSGLLDSPWVQHLNPPASIRWDYTESQNYAWLLIGLIPAVLFCLSLAGNYASLLTQTPSRIVFGCLTAPIAGLSLISFALFVCKVHSVSRFAVLFYALTSSFTLCAYRLCLRAYLRSRARKGAYAAAVLLVGPKAAVDRVALIFNDPELQTLYRPIGYISGPEGNVSSDPASAATESPAAAPKPDKRA
jgi:hypothetical protein